MPQGVLTESLPMTRHQGRRDDQTSHDGKILNDMRKSGQHCAAPTFQMCLFGDCVLLVDHLPVRSLDVPRLRSLLVCLVLHRGAPQSRSRLAYLLWPDSTDAQAHTNLRNALFKLRVTLPEVDSFLVVERQTLGFRGDTRFRLDVLDFERAIAQAEQARGIQNGTAERQALEEAVRLYQGHLVPSCYDEWILDERDRLHQTFLGALERLMELLEEERNYQAAIRAAQRLRSLDPFQESTYCHLMRLYAARGDRSAISRIYQTCAALLQCELSIAPGIRTRKTYEWLMQGEDEKCGTGVLQETLRETFLKRSFYYTDTR